MKVSVLSPRVNMSLCMWITLALTDVDHSAPYNLTDVDHSTPYILTDVDHSAPYNLTDVDHSAPCYLTYFSSMSAWSHFGGNSP